MDGITDFDMRFKRSLIDQLANLNKSITDLNKKLDKISQQLETQNDIQLGTDVYGNKRRI